MALQKVRSDLNDQKQHLQVQFLLTGIECSLKRIITNMINKQTACYCWLGVLLFPGLKEANLENPKKQQKLNLWTTLTYHFGSHSS